MDVKKVESIRTTSKGSLERLVACCMRGNLELVQNLLVKGSRDGNKHNEYMDYITEAIEKCSFKYTNRDNNQQNKILMANKKGRFSTLVKSSSTDFSFFGGFDKLDPRETMASVTVSGSLSFHNNGKDHIKAGNTVYFTARPGNNNVDYEPILTTSGPGEHSFSRLIGKKGEVVKTDPSKDGYATLQNFIRK